SDVRNAAALALERMGTAAQEASPALVKALNKNPSNPTLVQPDAVSSALIKVDPDAARRVGLLPGPPMWPNYVGGGVIALVALVVARRVQVRRRDRALLREERQERIARFLKRGAPEHAWVFLERHPEATPKQQLKILLMDQRHCWGLGSPRPVPEYL